jgi:hypothetical protein
MVQGYGVRISSCIERQNVKEYDNKGVSLIRRVFLMLNEKMECINSCWLIGLKVSLLFMSNYFESLLCLQCAEL